MKIAKNSRDTSIWRSKGEYERINAVGMQRKAADRE
jgi:hypothetical protein